MWSFYLQDWQGDSFITFTLHLLHLLANFQKCGVSIGRAAFFQFPYGAVLLFCHGDAAHSAINEAIM
jgi:hypothetical protein